MDKANQAVEMFREGYACSQAILAAYGPSQGLGKDMALRLAAGFAGGMRMGETCGAVTGAFMILGLRHCKGGCEAPGGRKPVYDAIGEFSQRFRAKSGGSLACKDILGVDVSTSSGMKAAQDGGLFTTICPRAVRDAAEILEKML